MYYICRGWRVTLPSVGNELNTSGNNTAALQGNICNRRRFRQWPFLIAPLFVVVAPLPTQGRQVNSRALMSAPRVSCARLAKSLPAWRGCRAAEHRELLPCASWSVRREWSAQDPMVLVVRQPLRLASCQLTRVWLWELLLQHGRCVTLKSCAYLTQSPASCCSSSSSMPPNLVQIAMICGRMASYLCRRHSRNVWFDWVNLRITQPPLRFSVNVVCKINSMYTMSSWNLCCYTIVSLYIARDVILY